MGKCWGWSRWGSTTITFSLGGDSIKAIQVAARLRPLGCKLAIAELFKHPTIRQLGPQIGVVTETIEQGEVAGEVKFTPIQEWFMGLELKQRHHFNQAVMLQRKEGYELKGLRAAFQELIAHHDALGLVLKADGSGLENLGVKERKAALEVIETKGADWKEQIEREANRVQGGLDLQHGPLFKAAVFQTEGGDYLLLVAHHLVIDGVSWRILVEDLEQGYVQARQGGKIVFAAKTHSYRRWSEKLREYGQSPALRTQRDYWRKVCEESQGEAAGREAYGRADGGNEERGDGAGGGAGPGAAGGGAPGVRDGDQRPFTHGAGSGGGGVGAAGEERRSTWKGTGGRKFLPG